MARSFRSLLTRAALAVGLSAAAALGTAGAALAGPPAPGTLQPDTTLCTASTYATRQVVLDENSTPGPARTVLYRGGVQVAKATGAGPHRLTGTGPGVYQGCVTNTGTAPTTVSLQLTVDGA